MKKITLALPLFLLWPLLCGSLQVQGPQINASFLTGFPAVPPGAETFSNL